MIEYHRQGNKPPPQICRRGHQYGEKDFNPNGQRICRQCKKDRAKALREERGTWRPTRNLKRENELRKERLRSSLEARARQAAAHKKWRRKKSNADPGYRLDQFVRSGVWHALRKGKAGRPWAALVGYTIDDLKAHLERQFTKGMSWGNYGQWHIDHIVPRSAFAFSNADDPEFHACWALTNLQPLWASENSRKSGKRLYLV